MLSSKKWYKWNALNFIVKWAPSNKVNDIRWQCRSAVNCMEFKCIGITWEKNCKRIQGECMEFAWKGIQLQMDTKPRRQRLKRDEEREGTLTLPEGFISHLAWLFFTKGKVRYSFMQQEDSMLKGRLVFLEIQFHVTKWHCTQGFVCAICLCNEMQISNFTGEKNYVWKTEIFFIEKN